MLQDGLEVPLDRDQSEGKNLLELNAEIRNTKLLEEHLGSHVLDLRDKLQH